jgi:hypothetical protein
MTCAQVCALELSDMFQDAMIEPLVSCVLPLSQLGVLDWPSLV